ncbi:hypothetical protein MBLNU13_g08365t1 [Cladosporium sp. NU13]
MKERIFVMRYTFLLATLSILVALCSSTDQQRLSPSIPSPDATGFHPTPPRQRHPVPSLFHARYSEQTFIGSHNSAAIRTKENNWSLSGNQYFNVSTQLASGVRLLQAQGHRDPHGGEQVRLCHFNCALMDGGSLDDFLAVVKDFLEREENEVITLLFVNTGVPLKFWAKAFFEAGLDVNSYIPPTDKRKGNMRISDWPAISSMSAMNKRLVTFLSSGADEEAVPFLLPEFDYIFETDFGIESPDQFSCGPARPSYPGSYVPDRLSLVNHFLYAKFLGFRFPNASFAATTNAAGFRVGELGEHAARCRNFYERRMNFLLVDFYNEGDVFEVERGMNLY